jgi:multidrug efflux pump subunit AcrA (membrane-fusion protein)
MNIKRIITFCIFAILFIDAGVFLVTIAGAHNKNSKLPNDDLQTAAVKPVDSSFIATGSITAENEADLHFQTAGKLVSVPLKEGDNVTEGETVAQLDTYELEQELSEALNNYTTTRDQFDQGQQNNSLNITQVDQRGQLNFYGVGIPQYGTDPTTTNYLDQVAQRIASENQASLNNSVINVQIANYALQMATLTSPLNGIVVHEDVTVPGQNITPDTSFVVADPSTYVFRANVPASDIDFINDGMQASVMLDGSQGELTGTVVRIYPSKITLDDGEDVYQVDIQSDQITNTGKMDQSGTAIIMTNAQNVILVPAWTVLGGKYIWIDNNGKPELKTVTVGILHGEDMEITGGLTKQDRIITDPKSIPAKEYQIL